MKVALVTQHFPPHFEGGTETVARAQGRALAALGHDVRVVAGSDRAHAGRDVESARVDGLEVLLLPRHPHEFYDVLLERPRLRALVGELVADRDVVHVHHWSTLDRELVRSLAAGRPVAVTLHDLFATCPRFFRQPEHGVERCPEPGDFGPCVECVAPDVPSVPRASLLEAFRQRHRHLQAELDAASLLVSPSRSHLERLRRYLELPPERTLVLPHGLAADVGRVPAPAEGAPGAEAPLRVGFLGHRARLKGAVDLARALGALPPGQRSRVELRYLGDEVEPGVDRAIRAAAPDLRIRFEPPYVLAELARRVAAGGGLHLAALPSRAYESYGLVVDEALAMGLPVWVSDRGAPAERVGEAGRVLPAGEPGAWTAAFAEVLADPAALVREKVAVPTAVPRAAEAAAVLAGRFEALLERAP